LLHRQEKAIVLQAMRPGAPLAAPAPVRQEALPESLLGTSFGMPLVQAEEGGKRNSFHQKISKKPTM